MQLGQRMLSKHQTVAAIRELKEWFLWNLECPAAYEERLTKYFSDKQLASDDRPAESQQLHLCLGIISSVPWAILAEKISLLTGCKCKQIISTFFSSDRKEFFQWLFEFFEALEKNIKVKTLRAHIWLSLQISPIKPISFHPLWWLLMTIVINYLCLKLSLNLKPWTIETFLFDFEIVTSLWMQSNRPVNN